MSNIKETIRQINLGVADKSNGGKVITFLSPGKVTAQKTLIANMAVMYSYASEKTLIIDTDFNSDSIAETFKIESKYGLSDFLDNPSIDSSQVVQHVIGQNVDVLPSGRLEQDETRFLLGDPKFDLLIKESKEKYSYILINTPIFNKIDSLNALNKVSEGFVLVVSLGDTRIKRLSKIMSNLRRHRANVLGYINVKKG